MYIVVNPRRIFYEVQIFYVGFRKEKEEFVVPLCAMEKKAFVVCAVGIDLPQF